MRVSTHSETPEAAQEPTATDELVLMYAKAWIITRPPREGAAIIHELAASLRVAEEDAEVIVMSSRGAPRRKAQREARAILRRHLPLLIEALTEGAI